MLKKSPSGSLCPYYYMGGELHPLKYGSYFTNKKELFAIIKAEEDFILSSPGTNNRRIWIDLYETNLDDEVIDCLVTHLQVIRHKILKLSLVGCSVKDKRRISSLMKSKNCDLADKTRYFRDPEDAKMWLIGEKNR